MKRPLGWIAAFALLLVFAAWLWRKREPAAAEASVTASTALLPPVSSLPSSTVAPRFVASRAVAVGPPEAEAVLRELDRLRQSDPKLALERALAADATLPERGAMAEARRALIVTLLVDSGRMADARQRTREFLESYPTSEYRPLVEGVTGIHPRPHPSESKGAVRVMPSAGP